MTSNRITVGASSWQLPAGDVTGTLEQIGQSLAGGSIAQLDLLDTATGNNVTVYLNGATTETVAIDLGGVPRPSEISSSERPAAPIRRLVVGASSWLLPTGDVTSTLKEIKQALMNGTVAQLDLRDAASGDSVIVYLNGSVANTVTIDLGADADADAEPSGTSG
jgi:hypothetical protein